MNLNTNIIKIAYTIYFASSVTFGASSGDPAWNHDYATQPAWGSLEKAGQPVPLNYPYADCSIGNKQSPIDLQSVATVKVVNKPAPHYPIESAPVFYNTGHAIQINSSEGYAGKLNIGNDSYPVIQYHLHAPSEHVIGTETFDGELHFVHVREDGKMAVLGVFLEGGHAANKTLQTILDNTPSSGAHYENPDISINPKLLLPKNLRNFYTYGGSLTTPPCSEGILWYVASKPLEISDDQINQIKSINTDNEGFPENNRLVQDLDGRVPTKK
jgi:carbonic anhydrase